MDAAPEDPITAWQKVNTFRCPHGVGRITPETCAELQRRPDISQASGAPHPSKPGKDYRPAACARCAEYQALWDEVARRRSRAGRQGKSKTGGATMPTYIDCLCCGTQDVPNTARGLCSTCYPQIPTKKRELYTLEAARRRRLDRLEAERRAPGDDSGQGVPGLDLSAEATQGVMRDITGEGPEPPGPHWGETGVTMEGASGDTIPDSRDPLAGYEFVSAQSQEAATREVKIDATGKTLGIGARVAEDHGLQPGQYVHVYARPGSLALRLLSGKETGAYKLAKEGRSKEHKHRGKLVITMQRIIRRGLVSPGQRFEVRREQDILFLDSREG